MQLLNKVKANWKHTTTQ